MTYCVHDAMNEARRDPHRAVIREYHIRVNPKTQNQARGGSRQLLETYQVNVSRKTGNRRRHQNSRRNEGMPISKPSLEGTGRRTTNNRLLVSAYNVRVRKRDKPSIYELKYLEHVKKIRAKKHENSVYHTSRAVDSVAAQPVISNMAASTKHHHTHSFCPEPCNRAHPTIPRIEGTLLE